MDASDERKQEKPGEKLTSEQIARHDFEEMIRKSRELIARVDETLGRNKQGDPPGRKG